MKAGEAPLSTPAAGNTIAQRRRLCGLSLPILSLIILLSPKPLLRPLVAQHATATLPHQAATSHQAAPLPNDHHHRLSRRRWLRVQFRQRQRHQLRVSDRGRLKYYCARDSPGNDLLGVIVPSFQACIEACASWNDKLRGNGDNVALCTAVPSWYNATGRVPSAPCTGDCFLGKNVTGWTQLVDVGRWLMWRLSCS